MAHFLALVGLALMVGVSGAGSAIGLAIGGSSVLGMLKRKPEAFGSGLVLSGLPATQGLYGFVAFMLYNGFVKADLTMFQGCVIFGAGLMVGVVCLLSAIYQGKVCANGIAAIAQGHNVFGQTMVLAAFPEFYAILSLVGAIIIQGMLNI